VPAETIFTMDTSSVRFGAGATREVGHEMAALGARRIMVVTDANLTRSAPVAAALDSLRAAGLDAVLYDRVRIEPTEGSFADAIAFATDGRFDGYVAVGGGSVMDTAKAANLHATYPAPLLTYVNTPVGEAKPVPGRLRPLIAVPTTAGTGSETTGVAIFDYTALHAKTGIAHRALRPVMGIIDPENTRTMPRMVAASSGLDVLSHAIESYTALPFHRRPAPEHPGMRPAYQGSNPISDVWAVRAIELVSKYLVRAVYDPADDEARAHMMLAAAFAGIGFGNAGVHLPHGMSYPVSGMVETYRPDGYAVDHPLVPHGFSVILCAPAVFRWTAAADPQRHLDAARMMGARVERAAPGQAAPQEAGELLAGAITALMRQLEVPNGLRAVGYGPQHVDALVHGTLPQHRVTKLSPRPATDGDLRQLFLDSMELW
jgi:hydroxyacid-oxoacid transhydrogenase